MKQVKIICAILGMSLVDVLKCVCQATVLLQYSDLLRTIHMHLCNQSGAGVEAFTLAAGHANWVCHAVACTMTWKTCRHSMQSGYGNHTGAIQVKFDFREQNGLTQHATLETI